MLFLRPGAVLIATRALSSNGAPRNRWILCASYRGPTANLFYEVDHVSGGKQSNAGVVVFVIAQGNSTKLFRPVKHS